MGGEAATMTMRNTQNIVLPETSSDVVQHEEHNKEEYYKMKIRYRNSANTSSAEPIIGRAL